MTDDEIRNRVRERLANGRLPARIPATGPVGPGQPTPPLIGLHEQPCAVCDGFGSQLRYDVPSGGLVFHPRCHAIWEKERTRA